MSILFLTLSDNTLPFWSCYLWLDSLISCLVSGFQLFHKWLFWSCHLQHDPLISGLVTYDLILLFPVLSSMTWLFYFQPCHLIFGLVSYDVTILILVLSSMTWAVFLVPSSMTWLSYFWSCHLWLDSLISSLVLFCLVSLSRIPLISYSGVSAFSSHYIPSGILRTRSSFFWRASGSNSRDQITLLQVSLWIQQPSQLMGYLHCQACWLTTFTSKPNDGLPSPAITDKTLDGLPCQSNLLNDGVISLTCLRLSIMSVFKSMHVCHQIYIKTDQDIFQNFIFLSITSKNQTSFV